MSCEYSCDRHNVLSPARASGLVLLASGSALDGERREHRRSAAGPDPAGGFWFWVTLTLLPRSHPFTVRRLERPGRLGLYTEMPPPPGIERETSGMTHRA